MDVQAARAQLFFVTVDAADALADFMLGDSPNPALFAVQIGAHLDSMPPWGSPPRVYGEMVALLCGPQDGNRGSAVLSLGLRCPTDRQGLGGVTDERRCAGLGTEKGRFHPPQDTLGP